jgi:hypothetical protein
MTSTQGLLPYFVKKPKTFKHGILSLKNAEGVEKIMPTVFSGCKCVSLADFMEICI